MTIFEAIKHCQDRAKKCDECGAEHRQLQEWMEELLQYQEIGTVEECRETVKKQRPMKVTDIHVDEYFCPACGAENCCDQGIVRDRYCPNCGQRLDIGGDASGQADPVPVHRRL